MAYDITIHNYVDMRTALGHISEEQEQEWQRSLFDKTIHPEILPQILAGGCYKNCGVKDPWNGLVFVIHTVKYMLRCLKVDYNKPAREILKDCLSVPEETYSHKLMEVSKDPADYQLNKSLLQYIPNVLIGFRMTL